MVAVRALLFDVFGTVVDWRGTIIKEGKAWNTAHRLNLEWGKFADEWRAGYQPSLDPIRRGTSPWVRLDIIHRAGLYRAC